MKIFISILIFISIAGFNANALASGVFKCVGSDGEMTFSFAPCAPSEPVEALGDEPRRVLISRFDQLKDLDTNIANLESQLDDTKRQYEDSLLSKSAAIKSDELTANFDQTSRSLIVQIIELNQKRERLARR